MFDPLYIVLSVQISELYVCSLCFSMLLCCDLNTDSYVTATASDFIVPLSRDLTLHRDFGMVLTSKFPKYCKSVFDDLKSI